MINKFIFILCSSLLQTCLLFSDMTDTGTIKWMTNYEEATNVSKASSKPMVLFFTGSDWCTWCNKLEEEALNTTAFANSVGTKFVFVKLDFPLYAPQDAQIKAQNKQVQQTFNVRSYPTVILYDAVQGKQIGTTGYRAGGGEAFGQYLLKIMSDNNYYQISLNALDDNKFQGHDLKILYGQAKKLEHYDAMTLITHVGLKSNEATYFQMESYRRLAEGNLLQTDEAVAIKQQLLASDPNNEKLIPYQIAVIEYEFLSSQEYYSLDQVVAPLTNYLTTYGDKDKLNGWRLQMIIAQVYLDQNQMSSALKYAQDSYNAAPSTVRPDINRAIQNIKNMAI